MDISGPKIPCPVCNECDHDLRSGVLELFTNIGDNVKNAAEAMLDGLEASNNGAVQFEDSAAQVADLIVQLNMVLTIIPDLASLKARNS